MIPIPEEIEKRIIDKIKHLDPVELIQHKSRTERELELYRRGYLDGRTRGYLDGYTQGYLESLEEE